MQAIDTITPAGDGAEGEGKREPPHLRARWQ